MPVLAEIGSSLLLFFLVYGMSATVQLDQLLVQIRNLKALGIGVSMQFVILPFIGFCAVKLFRLPAPVGITLLVITSSPGGSYSNWWCSMFNAELALSVTMTALSTLLSSVFLPLNLVLYTKYTYSPAVVQSLDWYALFVSICTVIGAITCGFITTSFYSTYRTKQQALAAQKRAHRLGNIAGLCLIGLSIAVSTSSTTSSNNDNSDNLDNLDNLDSSFPVDSSPSEQTVWNQHWTFYAGCAAPVVLGIVLATYSASRLAKLEKPECVAVAIESCYQNTGIATSVALTMFSRKDSDTASNLVPGSNDGDSLALAMGVPLYYGIVEAIVLGVFCIICWKKSWTKAPANENLCVVLATSYEVRETETRLALEQHEITAIEVILGNEDGMNFSTSKDHYDIIYSQSNNKDYVFDEVTLQKVLQLKKTRCDSRSDETVPDDEDEEEDENNDNDSIQQRVRRTPLVVSMWRQQFHRSIGCHKNRTLSIDLANSNGSSLSANSLRDDDDGVDVEMTAVQRNTSTNKTLINTIEESRMPNDLVPAISSLVTKTTSTTPTPSESDVDTKQLSSVGAVTASPLPNLQQHTVRLQRTISRVRARAAGYHPPPVPHSFSGDSVDLGSNKYNNNTLDVNCHIDDCCEHDIEQDAQESYIIAHDNDDAYSFTGSCVYGADGDDAITDDDTSVCSGRNSFVVPRRYQTVETISPCEKILQTEAEERIINAAGDNKKC